MNKEECIQAIRKSLPDIQRDYGVTGLTLFGSVARGDNTPESDIDLLVDMPPKFHILSALHKYLENLLHTSVDLIRRHSNLSSRFLNEIARDGITLL
ncbi:MAG: nucleotidyltransferase domain-containing protein [Muribaculaceae bacterium]|nr:nucleotidyltransferase domain-containing protein [Muribaculaceae bacterium]